MNETRRIRTYLLDTSALLAIWNDEAGADEVERILRVAPSRAKVFFSFMTLMEAKYRLWRSGGKGLAEEFERMLKNLPLTRVDLTDSILDWATEIKTTKRDSVADSWGSSQPLSRPGRRWCIKILNSNKSKTTYL